MKNLTALDAYDAGYLNAHGGGNVEWWHDYIRSELDRAHDFYQSQLDGQPIRYEVPEGWQLVPREVVAPTLSWPLDVGASAFERAKAAGCVLEDCIHDAVSAMLAAAPKPEAAQ